MKILKLILIVAVAMMVVTSCSQNSLRAKKGKAPKMLVLYYSQTSNTKTVAQEIATRLHADIDEIALVEPYDTAFQATIDRCKADREKGVTPEIKPLKSNVADYDVVFIGYPIWFGTYAPPIASLLDKIDLSGKTVVPFCTFGSGGLESSVKDLAAKLPDDERQQQGYGVRAARMSAVPREVEDFLARNYFADGKFDMPDPFPEQHPVTADEAAIFNAAVDGYPMLNAKATAVASRAIDDGTEYLFTAKDEPREKKADMPPASEIQVYVIVKNGSAPEFTKVVR